MAQIELDLLTTDQALDYLRRMNIHTSRTGLDRAFHEGRLTRVAARGRVRILYRPADLLSAFLIGDVTCRSNYSAGVKSGISAAPSLDSAFMKALALATSGKRKSTARGAKLRSSNVVPLEKQ